MKKKWKSLLVMLLTASMLSPLTIHAQEEPVFSDGEEITESIGQAETDMSADMPKLFSSEAPAEGFGTYLPYINTTQLPEGMEGEIYSFQLDGGVFGATPLWSLDESSELPEGMEFSESGKLYGIPKETGSFRLDIRITNGEAWNHRSMYLIINANLSKYPEYKIEVSPYSLKEDTPVLPVGTSYSTTIFIENNGQNGVHYCEPPKSKYFELSWDRDSQVEYPGLGHSDWSYIGLEVKSKKDLPQGKYEETVTIETKEGASCEVLLSVIFGPASENDYSLSYKENISITEDDFDDVEYRVQAYLYVKNIGQKDTHITLDTSELQYFEVDDQYPYPELWPDNYQDTERLLKPGESLIFYILPKLNYGTFQETFYLCTDDGSRFPVHISMNREEKKPVTPLFSISSDTIRFEAKTLNYKTLPEAKTITVENIVDEAISLHATANVGLKMVNLSKDVLEPGEKAEVTVQPFLGLKAGSHELKFYIRARSASGKESSGSCTACFYVDWKAFGGFEPLKPIKNLSNGTAKTIQGLRLPEFVSVYSAEQEKYTFDVRADWDIENCGYMPDSKEKQCFTVKGNLLMDPETNPDNLDTSISVEVEVNAYDPLGSPVFSTVNASRNLCTAELWDTVNEAEKYQFVVVNNTSELKSEKFLAKKVTSDLYATLEYIPKGTHFLYCRGLKTTGTKQTYGKWSAGKKITIAYETPTTPSTKKATVKKCDIMLDVSAGKNISGYTAVLVKNKNDLEQKNYVWSKTGYSGSSKQLLLHAVPSGTYYVGICSYTFDKYYKKVFSRWSSLKKVTIKNSRIITAPSIKSVSVSGRNVTVKVTLPKGTDGADWVLGKNCWRNNDGTYGQPYDYAYVQKNKTASTVTFKNVKPGTYYLSGHAYVKGYQKTFTSWANSKKVVIK